MQDSPKQRGTRIDRSSISSCFATDRFCQSSFQNRFHDLKINYRDKGIPSHLQGQASWPSSIERDSQWFLCVQKIKAASALGVWIQRCSHQKAEKFLFIWHWKGWYFRFAAGDVECKFGHRNRLCFSISINIFRCLHRAKTTIREAQRFTLSNALEIREAETSYTINCKHATFFSLLTNILEQIVVQASPMGRCSSHVIKKYIAVLIFWIFGVSLFANRKTHTEANFLRY